MPSFNCTNQIEIHAPASTVFAVVSDYPSWKRWVSFYHCDFIDSDELTVGTRVQHKLGYPPLIVSKFVREIKNIEANLWIDEAYIEGDLTGTGIWRFRQIESKTLVSYQCCVKSETLAMHFSFFLAGKLAHSLVYWFILKRLKAYCESLSGKESL